jgi:WD40 repeat protein
LKWLDPVNHQDLGQADVGLVHNIRFSPDDSRAILGGPLGVRVMDAHHRAVLQELPTRKTPGRIFPLVHAHYSNDGRLILAECVDTGLYVYDATRLQRVDPPEWIPADARQYVPAPTDKAAAVKTAGGAIRLWNPARQAVIKELDKPCELDDAAFSPDQTMLLTVTREKSAAYAGPRLRLWQVQTGELLHELLPHEQNGTQQVMGVSWTSDSRYILAATRGRQFLAPSSIGVWNAATGRYRGQFVGSSQYIHGFVVSADGRQLFAGSSDGKLRFWDFAAGISHIEAFERELPR